jgi:hypothetical protein
MRKLLHVILVSLMLVLLSGACSTAVGLGEECEESDDCRSEKCEGGKCSPYLCYSSAECGSDQHCSKGFLMREGLCEKND